jgi:hypothetical protein
MVRKVLHLKKRLIYRASSGKDVDIMKAFFADEKTFDQWPLVGVFVIVLLLATVASDIHFDDFPFFHKGLQVPDLFGAVFEFRSSFWPSDIWRKSTDTLVSLLTRPYVPITNK